MRVSQCVVGIIALFSALVFYHFLTAFLGAWANKQENANGGAVAAATAAWIDGQVAMSLERSIVQVALAQAPRDRRPLVELVAQQREVVSRHFEVAFASASRAGDDRLSGFGAFSRQGRRLIAELQTVRRALDVQLAAAPAGDEGARRLVRRLIVLIDESAAIRENLRARWSDASSYSLALAEIQRRAWEAREFAGRVRTPYAVATLNATPMDAPTQALIEERLDTARKAWRSLNAIAATIEPPPPLAAAIDAAEATYFQRHLATVAALDAELDAVVRLGAGGAGGAAGDGALSRTFPAFFEESSAALAAIRGVATAAGAEVARYWEVRRRKSVRQFWINGFVAFSAIAFTAFVAFFVRRRLVDPITEATRVLTRVASGDLDARIARRPRDFVEIAALHEALESFRRSLRQARRAEVDAKTDHLTGLPNRRDLEDLLANEARHRLRTGDSFAFVDLDEFKPINDTFGHDVGDKVLQEIAKRLRASSGGSEEIWRLGGDEFGLIWRTCPTESEALQCANLLREEICRPIRHGDHELFVGASIGVALYDDALVHPHELLSRADVAMFTAKQRPVGNVEVYSNQTSARRFGLDSRREICAALVKGQFYPTYQPQVDLSTGRLIGFEALAKWRRSDGTQVGPTEFFGMIEYFELQGAFDIAIANQTLETMRRLMTEYGQIPRFSINISEEALASSETRRHYLQMFEEYAECVPHLTIEVTENALTDRSASAIRNTLEGFVDAGVKLSMDDFGTGYGSFRHLQEYRFDEVKIDKSFVDKIGLDHSSDVIIEGFLAIARGLNAKVVAEGVEREAQREKLVALGCPFGQGFLFGAASTEAAAAEWIANDLARDRPAQAS